MQLKKQVGNISQIAEIAKLCGNNLNIYSGNDDQIVPILSLGGIGVISVLSNIMPEYTHSITENFFNKKIEEACKMQLEVIDLIKALFSEVNPIPVKMALNYIGYNYGEPRLPLVPMSEEKSDMLKNEMKKLNLI